MHSMADRAGQWIDKRLEKASSGDNPQLQAKRDALRQFFSAIPTASQNPRAAMEAMEKLANASGTLNDPEKEQHRQMMLERLRLAEAASDAGLLNTSMPDQGAAEGRYRLCEYVVVPGQEYLISGSCMENSAAATSGQDRRMIAKGRNEPTFLISTKSDAQVHREFEKRTLLMIFGGAALAIACAAGLLVHFGLF
jgi:hypothetical protein